MVTCSTVRRELRSRSFLYATLLGNKTEIALGSRGMVTLVTDVQGNASPAVVQFEVVPNPIWRQPYMTKGPPRWWPLNNPRRSIRVCLAPPVPFRLAPSPPGQCPIDHRRQRDACRVAPQVAPQEALAQREGAQTRRAHRVDPGRPV
jgi:hypothetical protein